MARGLLHGATVVLLIGLVSVLFAMFSPMWLVLRTELEEKQCWYGEGIWKSRYYWGSDLPLVRKPCSDPKRLGPYPTTTAYCHGGRPLLKYDDEDYNQNMCNSTNHAKITSILASLFAMAASLVTLFMGFAGGASTSMTFCARIVCSPLDRRQEFMAAMLALLCSVATIIFTFATQMIMLYSPLFSISHRAALSKTQVGMPFNGFSSCSFQTPMHSVFSLTSSAPMECLFAGPSFFTCLIVFICESLGAGFLLLLARDVWLRKRLELSSPRNGEMSEPLLSNQSGNESRHRFNSGFEEEHDDVLPASFRNVRRYSMYGAFARRFSKLSPFRKFCLLTIAPVFFMLGNAIAWASYSLLGIQIIVAAEMSFVSRETLSLMGESLPAYRNYSDVVRVVANPPDAAMSKLEEIHSKMGGYGNQQTFFRDIMNVFNFSPVTSLEYFWANEAYIIAVAVFFSVFIIPIGKVICWIWFFYAPSDEIFRGRFLAGLDAIGKYSLANLYVFCFLSIALCFDSEFIKLPFGKSTWFLFRIRAAVNAGNGIGSYMYVLNSVLSLFIGQFMCQVHSFASSWEEDRRARHGISYDSQVETRPNSNGIGDVAFLESPNYTVGDTPYMDSGGGLASLGFAGSSATTSLRNPLELSLATTGTTIPPTALNERGPSADELLPTFKSLASFGSTADLQRIQNQHGRVQSNVNVVAGGAAQQAPPEIMRALASFGSRTALNVLAARSERNRELRAHEVIEEEEDELDIDEENGVVKEGVHQARTSFEEEQEDGHQEDYVDVRTHSVKRTVLSEPIHPFVEAMCDRVHSPMQGARLKWTPWGKVFVWIWIFLLAGFVLICQSWDLVEIHKKGIAGDFIVKPIDRYRLYSLVSFTGSVAETGYEVPALELSTLFFFMTAVMPVLTTLGLAMMWTIPLTLDQQVALFNWLEIASAWSSLDIFFISIVAMYIELKDVTDKIISDAVPNLSELIRLILPFEDGTMSADMKIVDGFWVLLVAVVFEKFAIYLITEQAVTAISERRVEQFLRALAKQAAEKNKRMGEGSGSGSGMIDTGLLGDAAEGLLETEAMLVFAPTGRYTSAMFPRHVYAGLPRSWWIRIGVRFGFLADAKVVSRYDKTGEWFTLDGSEVQGNETFAIQEDVQKRTRSSLRTSETSKRRDRDDDVGDLGKKVSWGRFDDEIGHSDSKLSFGGEDDGPLSF